MPLKKLQLRPGVNQENTKYTSENGWYEGDKIRFRQSSPEKIGGWQRVSANTFLGTCRSLFPWVTLNNTKLIGVGTNEKFYIAASGTYKNVTPIRATATLTNPFTTYSGLTTVLVTDVAHGASTGDYVTFSGASAVGGVTIDGNYQVTVLTADTYNITTTTASSSATGGGTVTAKYEISVGAANVTPFNGWGAGAWGSGTWGVGGTSNESIRIWNQCNFGEDLLYGPRGGAIYYWDATAGYIPGVLLSSLPGASDVPEVHNLFLVSDSSRIVIAFGVNDYGSSVQNPMLIRWSDQEDATNWTPAATNQAGSLTLSHGSEIIAYIQVRQEILVFTDTSIYSFKYLLAEPWWGADLLADNISIVSDRAVATAAGVTYWMGSDKFYMYAGQVATLSCDLRQYVFEDFNETQSEQVFASTVEKFNEVWWFYCSKNSNTIDRYVVFNYLEKIWYYGTIARTAWMDAGIISHYPIAAGSNKLLYHEIGTDDLSGDETLPIESYITSAQFDIDDGHNFGFVWRVLPDVTFRGSTSENPSVDFTLYPLANSGSGYNVPASVGGENSRNVVRSATVPVEEFTGQVYIRVRGRQMALKISSSQIGVHWQLGSPRLDLRLDGRR